jgi:hypothetical protein
VMATWPGFDERLGRGSLLPGGEEHAAFFALLEAGQVVVGSPGPVVYHPRIYNWARRAMHARATAIAYMILLFIEHPQYRRRIARYVIEGARGTSRAWRPTTGKAPTGLSLWRRTFAVPLAAAMVLQVLTRG